MRWFGIGWYKYLFKFDCTKRSSKDKLMNIICRIRDHPNGITWYTLDFEPDMHCKDCGDYLG